MFNVDCVLWNWTKLLIKAMVLVGSQFDLLAKLIKNDWVFRETNQSKPLLYSVCPLLLGRCRDVL